MMVLYLVSNTTFANRVMYLHFVLCLYIGCFVSAAVFNLEKTFKITYSLLVLHMWLVLRRLKEDGQEGVDLGQYVYEIYNHDVELRVSKAGVRARLGFALI